MTMTRSERRGHGPQKKGLRNFHEKLDFNRSTQLLQQQADVQWQLLENQYHSENQKRSIAGLAKDSQYGQVVQSTEKHKGHFSEEAQLDGKLVAEANHVYVGVDPLLILAQSAEMVAEAENSFSVMHTSHQNKGSNNIQFEQMYPVNISNATAVDEESSQEVHDEMSLDSHVSSRRSGFSYEVTRPRVTQIRKEARTKYPFLDKENIEDCQCSHLYLQRKPTRLSQIKHQARCKNKNNLSTQEMIIENSNEQPQGRLVRMSQIKNLARCKGRSTAEEGTGNYEDVHLHCKQFEDNKREKVVECKLTKEAVHKSDFNLSAAKSLPANSSLSGHSQSSVENYQGHVSSNESSRITYECHQHVPNALPTQNNLKDYDRILARLRRAERIERKRASKEKHQSSHIPVQHKAASGEELHCTQLKEDYRCTVARQRRAELMKRKRASKDKHQCVENPVQQMAASGRDLHCTQLKEGHDSQHSATSLHTEANRDKQKKFSSVKGKIPISQMSISQLRREARLGNQCHASS